MATDVMDAGTQLDPTTEAKHIISLVRLRDILDPIEKIATFTMPSLIASSLVQIKQEHQTNPEQLRENHLHKGHAAKVQR